MGKINWTVENITDQSGKIVLITGASSGLGFETARVVANKNAEVIIAVRNIEKGNNAKEKILTQNADAKVKVMKIDLADLKSVKSFAKEFTENYPQLDLLINNAGVMMPPYSKTKDGFELQMGTNHFGHFALTGLLIELLKKTKSARIVNVASMAHNYGNLNFDDLTWEKRKYKPMKSYGDSKLANLYFTYSLADKLNDNGTNLKVTASHPGWTSTELQRHSGLFAFLNPYFAMSLEQGALTTLRAAFEDNVQNGDYFGPDGFKEWKGYPVKADSNKLSKDKSIAAKLWSISEDLTGVSYLKVK